MSKSVKKIKLELLIGVSGVYMTILILRLFSPLIAPRLSAFELQALNIATIYSLAIFPLGILLHSKEAFADYRITMHSLPKQIITGILIGLGMGCVLSLLPMALGLKELLYTGTTYQSTEEALPRLVYFIFVIGVVEEFIFRGFVYHKLKSICFSDVTPILISSLLFGMCHFSGLNFTQVLTTSLIGVFFCVCTERNSDCTILSLAIAHGIHDWLIRVFASLF